MVRDSVGAGLRKDIPAFHVRIHRLTETGSATMSNALSRSGATPPDSMFLEDVFRVDANVPDDARPASRGAR